MSRQHSVFYIPGTGWRQCYLHCSCQGLPSKGDYSVFWQQMTNLSIACTNEQNINCFLVGNEETGSQRTIILIIAMKYYRNYHPSTKYDIYFILKEGICMILLYSIYQLICKQRIFFICV